MDLTRSGVDSVQPSFGGVRFEGGSTIPLKRLIEMEQGGMYDARWSFVWNDLGTSYAIAPQLMLKVELDGDVVFSVESPKNGSNPSIFHYDPDNSWSNRLDELAYSLWILDSTGWRYDPIDLDPGIRIVDDRPLLEWDGSLVTARSIHKGDTVSLSLRNPNTDTLEVFEDHAGLRQLGDYVVELPPGGTCRMIWVATADPGEDVWVDLGWGGWGNVHRFQLAGPTR